MCFDAIRFTWLVILWVLGRADLPDSESQGAVASLLPVFQAHFGISVRMRTKL